MIQKNDQPIKDVLQSFVAQKKIVRGYTEVSVKKFWEDNMGLMINKYTNTIQLRRGVVRVSISSIPLRTELQYSKPKLLQMFQEEFGAEKVVEVRIV